MPRASRAKSARILLGAVAGTAVGHAPVEDCLLIDDKGRPLFRLSDYYGSFANDQRLKTQTTKDLPTADPLLTDFLFGLRHLPWLTATGGLRDQLPRTRTTTPNPSIATHKQPCGIRRAFRGPAQTRPCTASSSAGRG